MNFIRSKKIEKVYNKKLETLSKDECFICDRELLECEFKYWVLLRNRYPYSVKFLWWDIPVKNHYLLCPKRHIQKRTRLTKDEKNELYNLLEYKLRMFGFGYDISRWHTKQESSFEYHIHCQIIELGWFIDFLNRLV